MRKRKESLCSRGILFVSCDNFVRNPTPLHLQNEILDGLIHSCAHCPFADPLVSISNNKPSKAFRAAMTNAESAQCIGGLPSGRIAFEHQPMAMLPKLNWRAVGRGLIVYCAAVIEVSLPHCFRCDASSENRFSPGNHPEECFAKERALVSLFFGIAGHKHTVCPGRTPLSRHITRNGHVCQLMDDYEAPVSNVSTKLDVNAPNAPVPILLERSPRFGNGAHYARQSGEQHRPPYSSHERTIHGKMLDRLSHTQDLQPDIQSTRLITIVSRV